MPMFRMTVLRDGLVIGDEPVRAINAEQGANQLRLRFARCRPGETLILSLNGVEQGRLGPRRVAP